MPVDDGPKRLSRPDIECSLLRKTKDEISDIMVLGISLSHTKYDYLTAL